MNKNVLVVDDDEDIRETIKFILTQAGFTVSLCSTGNDIFNTIERTSPDLILLDIRLGEMDGRIICKAIKSNPEIDSIPIIIVSAEDNLYNTILEVGANDVIPKPFTEQILLSRINSLLSKAS